MIMSVYNMTSRSYGSMVLAMGKCHIVYMFESNLHPYIFLFRLVQTRPLYKAIAGCILVSDALNFLFINHLRTGDRDTRHDYSYYIL